MTIIQPVIMAGGQGTRLWPLSRPEKPKQFLPLVTSRPMIADVAALIGAHPQAQPPIVFTGKEYAQIARTALAGQCLERMVLEPVARSTAFVAAAVSLLVAE
ncbi:MAG: sugar phosphate nucleotidyltransferase, partial [bacterium]